MACLANQVLGVRRWLKQTPELEPGRVMGNVWECLESVTAGKLNRQSAGIIRRFPRQCFFLIGH